MVIIIHLILQKIYCCWIVWNHSIRVVIVLSFLAFAFLGIFIYLHSLSDFNPLFLAIWIAAGTAPVSIFQGQFYIADWIATLTVAGLALSIALVARLATVRFGPGSLIFQ